MSDQREIFSTAAPWNDINGQMNSTTLHPKLSLQLNTMNVKMEECLNKFGREMNLNIEGYCSPTWDTVLCWPQTKANSLAELPCPDFIEHFNPSEKVTRLCTSNGWFKNPETNDTWSNYTLCTNQHYLYKDWVPIIKTMSLVGYFTSLITLILAFFILVSIKKLRCPRNTLHIHLFVSFMLRAFLSLLKHSLFVEGLGLSNSIVSLDSDKLEFNDNQSNWQCKLLTSLWQYCIVANYVWILMEGLYLHNLIFLALFSDSSSITLYILIGWGCPLLVVASWATSRIFFDDYLCWTVSEFRERWISNLSYIYEIPITFTIVLNFIFFLNIVRVLLSKLSAAVSIESRKYRYRKWSKSTLVLMPLFGIHYMLLIGLKYIKNPVVEVIWLFGDQLFASFQGFFVAILYCLINGEVRSELGKRWKNWRSWKSEQGADSSKNFWVPLNQISSKFYHRSTKDEDLVTNGMSGGTSFQIGIQPERHLTNLTNELDIVSCCKSDQHNFEDVLLTSPKERAFIYKASPTKDDDAKFVGS